MGWPSFHRGEWSSASPLLRAAMMLRVGRVGSKCIFPRGICWDVILGERCARVDGPLILPRCGESGKSLLRGGGGAGAEVVETAVDPQLRQLLLKGVLAETLPEGAEVDVVERLVLVEAGEHDRLGAGRGILLHLQALRADLLHHALHRRVDGGDGDVVAL